MVTNNMSAEKIRDRVDLPLVADMIKSGSRVLDIGCGEID